MAETFKEEVNLEEFEMKEETVFKGKLPPPSTVEDTCTVYVHGEGIKGDDSKMKEEMADIKDEVITPSTVDDTCTVYVQGEGIKEEEREMKEEMADIKDEVITPSIVEDTCTVYVKGEDVKMENTGIQGKIQKLIKRTK